LNAFIVLAGVLVAISAVVLLTRPDPAPIPSPTTDAPPDFSLTDAEAIDRFEELDRLRLQAFETTDASLISSIFAPDSPLRATVVREIRQLSRGDVSLRVSQSIKRISVLANDSDEIKLHQVMVWDVRFFDGTGEDITEGGGRELQEIDWIMRLVRDRWLIYDAVVVEARPLD
jgi:hypothetical protein